MVQAVRHKAIGRLLVVMPTWLGDCVMATPTLRALRQAMPDTHITALTKKNVRPILGRCPWVDRVVTDRPRRGPRPRDARARGIPPTGRGPVGLARRLASGRFDAAVLLPNSFRAAMIVTLASIPRRIGYDRDGRGVMLTDRLVPHKGPRGFLPVPTLEYYLGIARYLGADKPDPTMELFTRPDDDRAADELLRRAGFDPDGERRLVLLNPGANKPEKRWAAERFAETADALAARCGAAVAVTGSPGEREVLEAVTRAAKTKVLDLGQAGMDLTLLKSVMRRADVLITNDTGPRHVAAAMRTAVVTLFGPTGPEWTEIGFPDERQVVAAGKTMEGIQPRGVIEHAAELLERSTPK